MPQTQNQMAQTLVNVLRSAAGVSGADIISTTTVSANVLSLVTQDGGTYTVTVTTP